jgi:hypothetical protein
MTSVEEDWKKPHIASIPKHRGPANDVAVYSTCELEHNLNRYVGVIPETN